MFGRRLDWRDYREDIFAFTDLLHDPPGVFSARSREFLHGVQRGYQRVGLTGAADAWNALGAACLWRACVSDDHIQFVMAGTSKSGYNWIRFLKQIASQSADHLRQHLLFSEDNSSVIVRGAQTPAITVLSPGHLAGISTIIHARPTTLVVPDVDRVPVKWMPALKRLVAGPEDQWLCIAPVRS